MNILVVGAGISGCAAARLLADQGHAVEVLDSRPHSGGNCHDERQGEVTVHCYGPHLFHTNDKEVWDFLSRFTGWTDYRHKVVADTSLGRISIPYSLKTEAQLGRKLSDGEIRELIFVDYSEKQWGVPWDDLPAAIKCRVPFRRDNGDDHYFTDAYQGQPAAGYAAMFNRMLEGIPLQVGVDKEAWRSRRQDFDRVIYTGKIDEYFGYACGRLPYRSLRFEHRRSAEGLPHAVINQCNRLPYTREYDHAWFNLESPAETLITREYPEAHHGSNEPYYPMPFGEGRELYRKYRDLAAGESDTIFLGRLATYSYLDMWMAVAQAMVKVRLLVKPDDPTDSIPTVAETITSP